MKLGGNVSALKAMSNVSFSGEKANLAPEQNPTVPTIEDGTKLIENTLKAMAQGWSDIRKFEDQPEVTLSPKQLDEKSKLEEKGLTVTVRPDGKFIVETKDEKGSWLSSSDIDNIAVLKGDFEIYNGNPQSDVEYSNLESVVGNLTISEFNDECRTSGPNWGYACDVKFTNLKQVTGNLNIQNSACQLYLDSLEDVGGSFNIDASCQTDNQVFLNKIKSINGDFNIQVGSVYSSPQIFAAVEGTMNTIPPKSHYVEGFGSCLIIGEHPNTKYYEFTTQEGVIKKYTIGK